MKSQLGTGFEIAGGVPNATRLSEKDEIMPIRSDVVVEPTYTY